MKTYIVIRQGFAQKIKIELPADFDKNQTIYTDIVTELDWDDVNNIIVSKEYMLNWAREYYPGKKIEAIKLHRLMTGAGLKESKDYIESLFAEIERR